MNPAHPLLPKLAAATNLQPVIIIDSREQTPLPISRFQTRTGTLTTGDYSFAGGEEHFSVERKTIADLVGCCLSANRPRFERELHRLRGFTFARLLIVGTREQIAAGKYRSQINPASVIASLNTWEVRYGVPVVFSKTEVDAARLVEDWVWWFAREWVLDANQLTKASVPSSSPDY